MVEPTSPTVESFHGTFEAESLISHGADTNTGITQRFRTERFDVADPATGEHYSEDVPIISGNSLRGQLRDLLAQDFLNALSDPDADDDADDTGDEETFEVSDTLSNALYSGGLLTASSAGPSHIRRRDVENIRESIPMLSVLGSGLTISGRLDMGRLQPICMETNHYTGRDEERSVYEAFVGDTFYTRSDDRDGDREEDEAATQMRYRTHVLTPGTRFDHEFALRGASDLERACIGRAFELFARRPTLGSMARVGHGLVSFEYDDELPDPAPYTTWLENNRADIAESVREIDEKVS